MIHISSELPDFTAYCAFYDSLEFSPGYEDYEFTSEKLLAAVSYDNDIITGVAILERKGHIGWLEELYANPVRGGVGSELLRNVEYQAQRAYLIQVELESRPDAVNFYIKRGYDILHSGEQPIMVKHLDEF